jgi:hypothetical protein
MGRCGLALEYARAAVVDCRAALDDAELSAPWEEATAQRQPPTTADSHHPNEHRPSGAAASAELDGRNEVYAVLIPLAVACLNLAVELGFVDRAAASVES